MTFFKFLHCINSVLHLYSFWRYWSYNRALYSYERKADLWSY